MHYVTVEQGRRMPGLRLVLTAGVPGPWSEAAKALFAVKKLPYVAVAQEGGGLNAELVAWTGQAAAPVAAWEDEPPRCDSLDILYLAERLAPEPRLIPEDVGERVAMFGLSREIIGRRGLGWGRRIMMLAPMMQSPEPPEAIARLASRYGYREQLLNTAPFEVARILEHLAAVLERQMGLGSAYFVGSSLSAVDVYWAIFSNMVAPLPPEQCAIPNWMREAWSNIGPVIAASLSPALIAHRDRIFEQYLELPLDFLPSSA